MSTVDNHYKSCKLRTGPSNLPHIHTCLPAIISSLFHGYYTVDWSSDDIADVGAHGRPESGVQLLSNSLVHLHVLLGRNQGTPGGRQLALHGVGGELAEIRKHAAVRAKGTKRGSFWGFNVLNIEKKNRSTFLFGNQLLQVHAWTTFVHQCNKLTRTSHHLDSQLAETSRPLHQLLCWPYSGPCWQSSWYLVRYKSVDITVIYYCFIGEPTGAMPSLQVVLNRQKVCHWKQTVITCGHGILFRFALVSNLSHIKKKSFRSLFLGPPKTNVFVSFF